MPIVLKIIGELLLLLGIVGLGGNLWACAKAPRYLQAFLRNPDELERVFDFIGREKIIIEAENIQPVTGSFRGNILMLGVVHLEAFRRTKNLMIVAVAILLIISYFLGLYFLIANVGLFLLLAFANFSDFMKNNNATHVHELVGNIYRWNILDEESCRSFCTDNDSVLSELYKLVSSLH
jgi:hypothetical protein